MIEENRQEFQRANILNWWNAGYKGQDIKIAVLETSVSMDNDVVLNDDKIIIHGEIASNDNGHASCVTRVIREVAPEAEIHVFRSGAGEEYIETHLDEFHLINCSFTGSGLTHTEDFPPIICSSGNNGSKDHVSYPARYEHTIAVGAYENFRDLTASYSQGGTGLDCVAFTDIYIPNSDGTSFPFTGTSCAAPMLTGMLALYMQKAGKKNWQEIRSFIQANCVDVMDEGLDNYSAFGLFVLPDPEDVIAEEDDEVVIEMTIGSKTAYIDGEAVQLSRAPEAKDGVTVVPIRFVAEALGCQVDYDNATKKITITDERG